MTTKHSGSCLCGSVTYAVSGDFNSFYICHCSHCQKGTGSAHAANLFASGAELVWLAGAELVNEFTLPGTRHSKSFCSRCGSGLPNRLAEGDMVMVPAGSLDSSIAIKPTAHIFCASQAEWESALADTPTFDRLSE